MNFHKHLKVTYDNYGRTYRAHSFCCNYCEINKSQIKKKDNRPTFPKSAVIF